MPSPREIVIGEKMAAERQARLNSASQQLVKEVVQNAFGIKVIRISNLYDRGNYLALPWNGENNEGGVAFIFEEGGSSNVVRVKSGRLEIKSPDSRAYALTVENGKPIERDLQGGVEFGPGSEYCIVAREEGAVAVERHIQGIVDEERVEHGDPTISQDFWEKRTLPYPGSR